MSERCDNKKPVRKAVIPAAGLGTRMLPIARAVPKEMLPIVDKPAIHYLVEEAANSGITDILIITNRGKGAMEDYFDYSPEYEDKLRSSGKESWIPPLYELVDRVNVTFVRQKVTRGLGDAVLRARSFTGDEPFLVLYGDDIIFSETKPACAQLIDVYNKYGKAVAGVKEVTPEQIRKYSSLRVKPLEERVYAVDTMIEKPAPGQEYSLFSVLGRVLLTPDIFDILERTPLGAGGELQLTDAMKTLAETEGMIALDFEGRRYDLGSKFGFLEANVERALLHPEVGEEFRKFLKNLKLD
ncbi:MAG TPA: UTP--glucose-1-phosphate uridylyltransferase [Bacillota bacterium]|nr:UTP--glucose-1-phosphate uridylyltransferase [Clostridiales bacterium]HPT85671.1 UTP--glucose-1-phosphate uridylyltransferase [Bacillota bacterium]